jgi:hypothetical protein
MCETPDVARENLDPTGSGFQYSGHEFHQGRFSRAVRADNDEKVSADDRKRKAF